MKVVFSDTKTGRSAQLQLEEDKAGTLMNMKMHDVVDGSILGLSGYKLKITGGSDKSGFPMDGSISGPLKTKVLKRVSMSGRDKGMYRRSTVCGNTISANTELVNMVITEYGDKPTSELFPDKEKKEEQK